MADLNKTAENLRKRGFLASIFKTKEEAAAYIAEQIGTASTVGFGGSKTIEAMGLYETLRDNGNTCYWHWKTPTNFKEAAFADYYMCSANGVSEEGVLILIDGNGNRVGACMYGHKKVFFVVGRNKLAPDYDSAMYRARNTAAVLNSRRFPDRDMPCHNLDHCIDCRAKDRGCRFFLTIAFPAGTGMPTEIVLVDEDLGY